MSNQIDTEIKEMLCIFMAESLLRSDSAKVFFTNSSHDDAPKSGY